jgi:hypothetical protein
MRRTETGSAICVARDFQSIVAQTKHRQTHRHSLQVPVSRLCVVLCLYHDIEHGPGEGPSSRNRKLSNHTLPHDHVCLGREGLYSPVFVPCHGLELSLVTHLHMSHSGQHQDHPVNSICVCCCRACTSDYMPCGPHAAPMCQPATTSRLSKQHCCTF